MKTLELRNASKPLSDYTAELDSESLVITSNDKPERGRLTKRCSRRAARDVDPNPERILARLAAER